MLGTCNPLETNLTYPKWGIRTHLYTIVSTCQEGWLWIYTKSKEARIETLRNIGKLLVVLAIILLFLFGIFSIYVFGTKIYENRSLNAQERASESCTKQNDPFCTNVLVLEWSSQFAYASSSQQVLLTEQYDLDPDQSILYLPEHLQQAYQASPLLLATSMNLFGVSGKFISPVY